MRERRPNYTVHIRFGGFELNLVGKRTILVWTAIVASFLLAKLFALRALEML